MTGMGILGASPTAAALAGAAAGKGAVPPRTQEDEELRQLLPEEQMPKAAAEKCSEIGKCSGCGKMSKLSELGKCGSCGGKHKAAGFRMEIGIGR